MQQLSMQQRGDRENGNKTALSLVAAAGCNTGYIRNCYTLPLDIKNVAIHLIIFALFHVNTIDFLRSQAPSVLY